MPTLTPRGESGVLAGPHRALRNLAGEPGHVVVTADLGHAPVRREPPDRVGRGCRIRGLVCQRPTPALTGLPRRAHAVGQQRDLLGQDACKRPVRRWVLLVRSGLRRVAEGRPSPADRRRGIAHCQPGFHELVEMLSDGVRVQIHGFCQLADAHRARGPLKHREEPSSADPGQDAVALLRRSHDLHFAL